MKNTLALIELSQKGDKEARDRLMKENMGLVHHVVKRFLRRKAEEEDLFQTGCIGLMKAIDHFNLNYDVQFSTYAVPMIMGEIRRYLRDDGIVKVSRSMKENGRRVWKAAEDLSKRLGRNVEIEDVAKETGLSREEVVQAMEATHEVESIYQIVYEGDGKSMTLAEKLPAKKNEQEELIDRIFLQELLLNLTKEERELLYLRYYDNVTQSEIAKRLGISQVQVSRTEKKLLCRMRNSLH